MQDGAKSRRSIATSFIFIVLLILLVGQGSLWAWFLFTQKENAMSTLRDKVEMASGFLSDASAEAISFNNITLLRRHAESVTADKDILAVRVRDGGGKILVYTSKGAIEKSRGVMNPFFLPSKQSLSRPVFFEGEKIGSVELVYSGERANEFMVGLLTMPPAAQVVVFLAIIYAIYFYFQRKVGIPVRQLRYAIRRITEGELSTVVPELANNELGEIADGLRFLTGRLSSTVQRLHATAEAVSVTTETMRETFESTVSLIRKQSASMGNIALSLSTAIESQKKIIGSTEDLTSFSAENVAFLLEVKATADEIVTGMESLFEAAEISYATMVQMSQTSKTMDSSAREVLSSVENTSTSVEQILASIKEVEKHAKESSALAERVRTEAAQEGINTVAEAVRGMEKITEKIRFSVDIVQRLDARSEDIQGILAIIREVTEKANLLSLNAAILAEQAGEHGKGFMVVSEEMRALSDRTAANAKEIAGIVTTIQDEIKEAVASITDGMELVSQGGGIVYRVGETMSSILENSHKSATMTKLIERATEDQAQALRHIEASVIDINRMAHDLSKAAEEQHDGSRHMLERVGEVREIAEATKKGTEEQAGGTRLIAKNLESADEKVAGISRSVLEQQNDNQKLITEVDELSEAAARTLQDVVAVSISLDRLLDDIRMLRKETETFRYG